MRTWFVGLVLGTVLSGCGSEDDDNQDPEGAKKLLASVRADDYQSWTRAPGWPERAPTSAPHSDEVDIYVNDILEMATMTGGTTQWPLGSIVAKDGFRGENLEIVALMEKRTDGWFYAELSGNGEPMFSGQPAICTDCHDSGDDYIRAFDFPP
jgi:hypothetical protein